jgi:hypothetical protein
VAGETNPADIYTKHLPTRDKLVQLVGLMGCTYRGGRAEAAPLTRTADTGKTTIAEADLNVCSVYEPRASMPHLDFNEHDLDRQFPTLCVPQEIDDDNETNWDSWDKVYSRGLEIIDHIKTTMRTVGRRRCEQPTIDNQRPHSNDHNHPPTTTTTHRRQRPSTDY